MTIHATFVALCALFCLTMSAVFWWQSRKVSRADRWVMYLFMLVWAAFGAWAVFDYALPPAPRQGHDMNREAVWWWFVYAMLVAQIVAVAAVAFVGANKDDKWAAWLFRLWCLVLVAAVVRIGFVGHEATGHACHGP